MNNTQILNRNFEAIAWGALLIWWGITALVPSLPNGAGAIGIGLILIGVNIARSLAGIPISRFSTAIGILALVWGGLELTGVLPALQDTAAVQINTLHNPNNPSRIDPAEKK